MNHTNRYQNEFSMHLISKTMIVYHPIYIYVAVVNINLCFTKFILYLYKYDNNKRNNTIEYVKEFK